MYLQSSPHQHGQNGTAALMRTVIYCLIPGILAHAVFFGWGIFIQIALAVLTSVLCEAAIMELRKRPIEPVISDYSGVLTAILLAIAIPSYAPWWVIVIGTLFAIIFVKHLYGGLGNNIFNPAMAAYVMLLISFPVQMTSWLPDQFVALRSFNPTDSFMIIFTGFSVEGFSLEQMQQTIDGISAATPLDQLRTSLTLGLSTDEIFAASYLDSFGNRSSFWISIGYLIGGLILWRAKGINWHIPLAVIGSLFVCAFIGFIFAPDTLAPPSFHLFTGATMLGAFFIATDPVSACTTNKGRLIYGAVIGALVYLIRTYGNYPDAFAFAVLLANMAVPLLDYYTKPTVYGHKQQ